MVAREVIRADGDVEGVAVAEALEDVAITEDTAEDEAVAEKEETEEKGAREAREAIEVVTAEAEGGRGDSMMTAEKTDGTIDPEVEGEKHETIQSWILIYPILLSLVVDAADTEVVEAPGEVEVRMASVNNLRVVW